MLTVIPKSLVHREGVINAMTLAQFKRDLSDCLGTKTVLSEVAYEGTLDKIEEAEDGLPANARKLSD